jgi:hypothetical protein
MIEKIDNVHSVETNRIDDEYLKPSYKLDVINKDNLNKVFGEY